jgi:predicted dehydrogenase
VVTVRVGVVGCGWWSTATHLPALQADPRAAIAALVDRDPARLQAAAERFGVSDVYSDVGEMVNSAELDAVVIAVPHTAHYPVAKVALERGLHTLLEKPMTLDPAHASELIALAGSRGCELMIDYPWHYNVQALAIKEGLARGRIGPIEHVSCFFASIARELYAGRPESYRDVLGYTLAMPSSNTYSDPRIAGGGQAQTQVTHAAALLLWMTGLVVEQLTAFVGRLELEVDLTNAVALVFEGGALGTLSSTGSLIPEHEEVLEYRILGRDGYVAFDVNQGEASFHTATGTEPLAALPLAERYPSWAPVRNLVDVALGHGVNGSPAEIGLASVEFVDALYRSAATRAPVDMGRAAARGAESTPGRGAPQPRSTR